MNKKAIRAALAILDAFLIPSDSLSSLTTMSLSLSEFKKLIGSLADKLTEDQIEWLYDAELKIADAIIDWWLHKRNASREIDENSEKENNASAEPPA
jgi:hypothetical protein